MDLGLRGRTAIVCGASSGMGLAIAESLAAEGANVAMFARRRDLLEREADRIGALAVRGDLTNPQHLALLVERTIEAFGGVDVLVLNGGGPPPATRGRADGRRGRGAPSSCCCSRPSASSASACRTSARADDGRVVAITSSSVREPIPNLALSNAVRPGRRRLAEDARARARPRRRDGERDRARPDRHRPRARGLRPRRPERGRPRGDPAAADRRGAGDRRRRLLPRVRPGSLCDRYRASPSTAASLAVCFRR